MFLRFSWSSLNGRYRSSSRANFRENACGFFERTGQWADWTDCHSEEVRVLRDLAARLSRVPKRVFCRFSGRLAHAELEKLVNLRETAQTLGK